MPEIDGQNQSESSVKSIENRTSGTPSASIVFINRQCSVQNSSFFDRISSFFPDCSPACATVPPEKIAPGHCHHRQSHAQAISQEHTYKHAKFTF